MKADRNLFIVPYTTEENYRNNVFKILTLLKDNTNLDEIILTEGEYSYTDKRHDVYEYSKIFDLPHRHHSLIQWSIDAKHLRQTKNVEECGNDFEPYKNLKYIVCIGTCAVGLVSPGFAGENPEINIVHIQGPIRPNYYNVDKFEGLNRFEVDVNQLSDILTFQFLP